MRPDSASNAFSYVCVVKVPVVVVPVVLVVFSPTMRVLQCTDTIYGGCGNSSGHPTGMPWVTRMFNVGEQAVTVMGTNGIIDR
jgi:hypothetical protein